MINESFTPIPNIFFDKILKELNKSELKLLLIILRQTHGWIDIKSNNRKERDRISQSQFMKKTGLSRRIISKSIESLLEKELITLTDIQGNSLNLPSKRQGHLAIYYSHLLNPTCALLDMNLCTFKHEHVQKGEHNKRNYNKRKLTKEREIEFKHIKEILDQKKLKWNIK